MVSLRTVCSHHLFTFLKHQNTSLFLRNPSHRTLSFASSSPKFQDLSSSIISVFFPLIFQRLLSSTAQLVSADVVEERMENNGQSIMKLKYKEEKKKKKKGKKPLDIMVKGVVGLNAKMEANGSSEEELKGGEFLSDSNLTEIEDSGKKLRTLEGEMSILKGNGKGTEKKKKKTLKSEKGTPTVHFKHNSLYSLFAPKPNTLNPELVRNSGENKRKTSKSEGARTVHSEKNSLYSSLAPKTNSLLSVPVKTSGENNKKKMTSEEGAPTIQSEESSLDSLVAPTPNSLHSVFVKNSGENKKKTLKSEGGALTVQSEQDNFYSSFAPKPNSLLSLSRKNSGENKKYDAFDGERFSGSVERKPFKKDRPIEKELSPEMVSLVNQWYKEGYLNNANYMSKKLDLGSFSNDYSCDYLRFSAEKFGRDHQEIAKWLSGYNLKRVAIFGCPSAEKKTAFAAKRLRSFFSIQEDSVCQSCKLKNSCKFVNQNVWKKVDNLNLADVMRVLTLYALSPVRTQLAMPDEVRTSVNKLLKEVVNLSQ